MPKRARKQRGLPFREAKTALQKLDLEPIDVLRVAIGGQGVEVLASLEPWLKDVKVIYVEFGSEQARKQIDRMRDPSHMIWQGEIFQGSYGCLCYLSRAALRKGADQSRKAVHDFEQQIGVFFRMHNVYEALGYQEIEADSWLIPAWFSPSENIPIVKNRDSLTETTLPQGIRLSKFNVVLFPYWELETEQLAEELEKLLEQILLSPNSKDYALILLGDPDPQLANQTLEMAAGNVILRLMEKGQEVAEEPLCSVMSRLNPWQWERLIQHMNYRYPLKRERFPRELRPTVQKLPVLLIAE